MEAVCLDVKGSFNSLRVARGLKYHRTYYIPPKTALIGLLGAALGFDDKELVDQNLYNSVLTNAVLDGYCGIADDLWIITKLKTGGEPETSPIMREVLVEPRYHIYYALKDASVTLDQIIDAFHDPTFALSLGRSDELIEVKEISKINLQHNNEGYFKNTLLPFNYKKFNSELEKPQLSKGKVYSLPQVISIPTSFTIKEDRIRKPSNYLQATIVYDLGVKIYDKKDWWCDDERRFFLY